MRRLRNPSGQVTSELLGVLVVVSVIVAALALTPAGRQIARHIECVVASIVGLPCPGEEEADNPGEPDEPCVVASADKSLTLSGNADIRVVNVELEGGVKYTRVKRADGTVAITVSLNTGGNVGPALIDKLNVPGLQDVSVGGGQEAAVTFVLPDDEAANRFADQLQETTLAIAAGPIISRVAGWDAHIDVPPVESVSFQAGPGATVGFGADAGTGYAEGSLDVSQALGVEHNFQDGETTVFYKASGEGSGDIGLLFQDAGIRLEGEWQLGVTFDNRGRPVSLKLSGAAGYNGELDLAEVNLETMLKGLSGGAAELEDFDGEGKKLEFEAELDLTNPALQRAVMTFLTGVDPQTGRSVDRRTGARELWDAMKNGSTVNYRTYDTSHTEDGVSIDVGVGGAGINYTTNAQELTGAYYFDPVQGRFVPWEACRKP